jgi:hypothetical protein
VLSDTDVAALCDAIVAALVATGLPWLTDTAAPEPSTHREGFFARWRTRRGKG